MLSFVEGYPSFLSFPIHEGITVALFLRDGDEAMEIHGRGRLDRAAAHRMMIREMIIMRDMGYTYREIGLKYRVSRVWASRLIREAPRHVKERLREVGLV